MALKNRFRIVTLDLYGFCGRAHHPAETDIGLTVTAVKMDARFFDSAGHESPVIEGDDLRVEPGFLVTLADAVTDTTPEGAEVCESVIWFYTCVTEDGRLLEMADFELEPLT
jgi:hypothetical protein